MWIELRQKTIDYRAAAHTNGNLYRSLFIFGFRWIDSFFFFVFRQVIKITCAKTNDCITF